MIYFNEKISRKQMVLFLLPLLFSCVFQQIYSPISTAAAGRYLNERAVAVIGACSAYRSVEESLFVSMTTGFAICINRLVGPGNEIRVRNAFWEAMRLTGILMLIGGLPAIFTDSFMELANIPIEMRPEARAYVIYLFLGGGFWGFQNLLTCVIQGYGETRFTAAAAVLGAVIQTGLSVFLLAALHMGVEALSLSILLTNAGMTCALLAYMIFREWGRELLKRPFERCTAAMWRELLTSGTAKSAMMLMASMGYFVLQRRVNRFSVDTIAGYTYGRSLMQLFMQPLCAYASAANIMCAQNAGNKNLKMLSYYNRKMMIGSMYWCAAYILAIPLASQTFIRLMAGTKVSQELIMAGSRWLTMAAIAYPFLVVLMLCRNALQGMGHYRPLLLFGLLELSMNLTTANVLAPIWGYGAVCFNPLLIWGVPGLTAYWIYRKQLSREMKAVKNE